ncbi:MAG: threonine synthase [Phycisphaerales bacterium]|nr:threonine synthase [Phycisphaerae bacterium]NNF44610.1 threonine synthase [Phycisphaerales bacterium]NNM25363.1 threonine synthase [Phycisphaerales bacterium]
MASFVTHLVSALDDTRLPARTVQTVHEGRPLLVRYDLDRVAASVDRDAWRRRPPTMWRYRELLPHESEDDAVTLGETHTPLLRCPRLGARLGVNHLLIKDESRLPTGSFKARGMAMAVTMARALGVRHLAVPTAGNAGGALAAYAARAGLPCDVFMPEDTPVVNRVEAAIYGARTWCVDGLIGDCGRLVREGAAAIGWFDMSTLKEPYRLEGKKTMGLELADQMGWRLPAAIFYPTGGGTGLLGMDKAFEELASLGWLDASTRPRFYACQSSGCPPIADAFARDLRFAETPPDPHTIASGLRVPAAVGDFMILDAVRRSGGRAVAADEHRLAAMTAEACRLEGLAICPETAACLLALETEVGAGGVDPDEPVVVFNTGAVQKYVEVMPDDAPRVKRAEPFEWSRLQSSSLSRLSR